MAEFLPVQMGRMFSAGLIDELEEPPEEPPWYLQFELPEDTPMLEEEWQPPKRPKAPPKKPVLPDVQKLAIPKALPPAPLPAPAVVITVIKRPPPRHVSKGASPSSLARNTKVQVPPSQRAKNHAAKVKRLAAKYMPSPGPAHYEPTRAEKKVNALSSVSFNSKTAGAGQSLKERDFVPAGTEHNGPGAYFPEEHNQLGNSASKSFSRSGRSGVYSFGSMSNRELQLICKDLNESPGPQTYATTRHIEPMGGSGGGGSPSHGSPMFRSLSPQRLPAPTKDNPGPAYYDPNIDTVKPSRETHSPSKVGRDARFVSDALALASSVTDSAVGPGTYQGASTVRTIGYELEQMLDHGMSRQYASGTVGFGMRRLDGDSHELPHETLMKGPQKNFPGPGAYEHAPSPEAQGKGHGSAFSTGTKRLDESIEVRMFRGMDGDPGAYDPHAPRELGAEATQSFSRSMNSGLGNFGTNAKRQTEEPERPTKTPGPAAYNQDSGLINTKAPIGAIEGHGSIATVSFRSKTPQRPQVYHNDLPGPAEYDPQISAIKPLSYHGAISSVGRDSRYVSDRQTIAGPDTGPSVGPSSYDPRKTRGGEWATIADRAEERRQTGGRNSQTFLSDVMRNLLQWFMPGEPGATFQNVF